MTFFRKILRTIILLVFFFLFSCSNNDDDNIVILISNKINNNEILSDNDFIYSEYNLKNVFYPDTLHTTLYRLNLQNTDTIKDFICGLQNIIISDTILFSDINSYHIFFKIADNHIQYSQKDTTQIKYDVSAFGYGILSCLAHSIENNQIQIGSVLFKEFEEYGYIIPPPKPSDWEKLWRNVKEGDWEYIFKRISQQIQRN
ncbi:MAG: hypothetical protein LBN27_08095 [Prevotellaceae bacterium]|jgi:hypothetical protein|nr:hypothetical protein [Prevotellaceae bacterium]